MFDPTQFALFFTAALLLLVIPGPAVMYIIARSIDQGRNAGIASTLGVAVGTMGHVLAAALGLSALLLRSATAFNIVKYMGAAYLIFLGIRKLLEREPAVTTEAITAQPLSRIFTQGMLVNLLNPKTALFFFAFLPQFVDARRGSISLQFVFLGVVFVVMGIFSDGLYAVFAGTLGGWFKRNLGFMKTQRYFAGIVYITLGIGTALTGSHRK